MELIISQAARSLQVPRPNIYYAIEVEHFTPKSSKVIVPKELVKLKAALEKMRSHPIAVREENSTRLGKKMRTKYCEKCAVSPFCP